MKCRICKTEFEGKVCPNCGAMKYVKMAPNKPASNIYKANKKAHHSEYRVPTGKKSSNNQPSRKNSQGVYLKKSQSTNSKNEIFNKKWFLPSIGIIIIAIIGLIIGLSVNSSKNSFNVPEEYTLSAGIYTAGIDFPSGKCNATAISGSGSFISSNIDDGGVNKLFGVDTSESGEYTSNFKNLKLPSGTTLTITGKLKVKLNFTKISSNYTTRTYDETSAIILKSGDYVTGKDFPAGVYKILANSGNGNLISSNMMSDGVNEMFGIEDDFFNNQFLNASFKKDDTLKISGTLEVKLIPAHTSN